MSVYVYNLITEQLNNNGYGLEDIKVMHVYLKRLIFSNIGIDYSSSFGITQEDFDEFTKDMAVKRRMLPGLYDMQMIVKMFCVKLTTTNYVCRYVDVLKRTDEYYVKVQLDIV